MSINVISLRAYITYSDRWSGSQVSAAYIKWLVIIFPTSRFMIQNYATILANKQFIARENQLPVHFGRAATEL